MDDDIRLAAVVIGAPLLVCGFAIALIVFDSPDITKALLLLVAAVFALVSAVQFSGRGAWVVAGYNTMTEKEKAQYNPKVIARGSGVIMLGLAAFFALVSFGKDYLIAGFLVLAIGMFLGILVMRRATRN